MRNILRHHIIVPPWLSAMLVLGLWLTNCTPRYAAPSPASPVSGLPTGTGGQPWWNDTVFYQIFVRSFYDSDGDGSGDLKGILSKLDYLNDGDPAANDDLGVTGLWLMPIHPATSYHGYDVTDYYAIHPDYGSLDDFKLLLAEAHQRGMRVIIDLVLNHTSCQHPWFQSAQDPASTYRDWYVWSQTEPVGSGWHPSDAGFYFGIFQECMPDLNYTNPQVEAEMKNVVRFWLEEVGVDGFRLDAAKHLIEQGSIQSHSPATHTWYEGFRSDYKAINPQALTVGEVWDSSVAVKAYLEGEELDLAFSFDLAKAWILSARLGKAEEAASLLKREAGLFHPNQFAVFLTNHDQDRIMTLLADEMQKGKIAASMLLTAPGVPFIYYGEEIGMLGKKPDEMIRTPMQWSAQPNGGFTNGQPWEAVNPDFTTKNVAAQSKETGSLLNHYRKLIHLRRQYAALRIGGYLPVTASQPSILAFLRHSSSPDETLLVIINLASEPVSDFSLSLPEGPLLGSYRIAPVLAEMKLDGFTENLPATSTGGFGEYRPMTSLPAFSTIILQLLPVE
ncbi:MAG: hypothetical protein JXB15_16720 [Anaerolineales bacterium]|nr:hypothetical protein [Anaerolineales bacterium]